MDSPEATSSSISLYTCTEAHHPHILHFTWVIGQGWDIHDCCRTSPAWLVTML